jgi:hypothetical protein
MIGALAGQLGTVTNAASVSADNPDPNPNNNTTSVPLQVFDVCLQDDSIPAVVFLGNSVTGDYRFCCNGTVFTGTATAYKKGSTVTFEHNAADRRVLAKVDGAVSRGTATLQSLPGSIRCTVTDRNTRPILRSLGGVAHLRRFDAELETLRRGSGPTRRKTWLMRYLFFKEHKGSGVELLLPFTLY